MTYHTETFAVGDTTVTRIFEDWYTGQRPEAFFPNWDPQMLEEQKHWIAPNHFDLDKGEILIGVQSWLIRTKHHCILVDCCCGNHKEREDRPQWHRQNLPYLTKLAAAGARPEDVDIVLCTHLHADHVGWNTQLIDGRWVPTFPNARYLFSKTDYDHFEAQERETGHAAHGSFADSVLPVVAAQMADLVDGNHVINDSMHLDPMPGHTPGHVVLNLLSGDARAVFSGDVLHHAFQVAYPGLDSRSFTDLHQARASRLKVLSQCSEHNIQLFPGHFGAPYSFRVVEKNGSFALRTPD